VRGQHASGVEAGGIPCGAIVFSRFFVPRRMQSRRLPPAHTSRASPDPHGSLAVAPLIPDKRCYGETPARLRRAPRDGRVQAWRNRKPEARLLRSKVGFGRFRETRETDDNPGAVRRARRCQERTSFPRWVMARQPSHRKQRRTRNWAISGITPAGYTINMGCTPGLFRGATGQTPSAPTERSRGRGGGSSGIGATAAGYAIRPPIDPAEVGC
jgi:hypothetical protein